MLALENRYNELYLNKFNGFETVINLWDNNIRIVIGNNAKYRIEEEKLKTK